MGQNRIAEETLSVLCEKQTLGRNQEVETSMETVVIVEKEQRECLDQCRSRGDGEQQGG